MHILPTVLSALGGEAFKPDLFIIVTLAGLALVLLFALIVAFALVIKFWKRSFNLLAAAAFLLVVALVAAAAWTLVGYLNGGDPYADTQSWLITVAFWVMIGSLVIGAFGTVRFVAKMLRAKSA